MRAALAGAFFAACLSATPLAAEPGFVPIEVTTRPVTGFLAASPETRFGDLEFLGGLEIRSRNADFGGLSGIAFSADGETLVAVGDNGIWFTARLNEDNGRLTGLSDSAIAPMLLDNGKPPARKADADAEGVRLVVRNGVPTALVSFEQTAAMRQYVGPDFASATPQRLKLPEFVKGIRRNQGLEAIAVAPSGGVLGGATLVIAERSPDGRGNHRGFVLAGPRAGQFSILRSDDFDVTDADFLPNGDLVLLERRFSYSAGFAMRLRRIAGGAITPGATVDGAVLIEADSRFEIDNMEGVALRTVNGETIVTLISDDNGSMFQRTMLLEFALRPTR